MIQVGDKEIDALYYVDEEGVQKEVEAVYLGEEQVWPEGESDEPNIHIKGTFIAGTLGANRYVYINGKKVTLDMEFDYMSDEVWRYGLAENNPDPWFRSLDSLIFLSDTSQMTNMNCMFQNLGNIPSLDLGERFDTKNVTSMRKMFYGCSALTSLRLGDKFDTSNVEDMQYMFHSCQSLKSIDLGKNFDTRKVKYMLSMFRASYALLSLDLGDKFDTSEVINMDTMFGYCELLETLNLGDKFDMGNVTNTGSMFSRCLALANVTGTISNLKANLSLYASPLTPDSAMVFINGLSDEASKQTLTLSSTTYDSLTPEQIAIATAKGWNVTRSA